MKYYEENKDRILEQKKEYDQRPETKQKRIDYNRKYRQKPDNALQKRAHKKVENAIKFGKIQRQPCEVCGNPNSQAHHDDYNKPMVVRWLCQPHHREAHKSSG